MFKIGGPDSILCEDEYTTGACESNEKVHEKFPFVEFNEDGIIPNTETDTPIHTESFRKDRQRNFIPANLNANEELPVKGPLNVALKLEAEETGKRSVTMQVADALFIRHC